MVLFFFFSFSLLLTFSPILPLVRNRSFMWYLCNLFHTPWFSLFLASVCVCFFPFTYPTLISTIFGSTYGSRSYSNGSAHGAIRNKPNQNLDGGAWCLLENSPQKAFCIGTRDRYCFNIHTFHTRTHTAIHSHFPCNRSFHRSFTPACWDGLTIEKGDIFVLRTVFRYRFVVQIVSVQPGWKDGARGKGGS